MRRLAKIFRNLVSGKGFVGSVNFTFFYPCLDGDTICRIAYNAFYIQVWLIKSFDFLALVMFYGCYFIYSKCGNFSLQSMLAHLRFLHIACAAKARPRSVTLTRATRDEILHFSILGMSCVYNVMRLWVSRITQRHSTHFKLILVLICFMRSQFLVIWPKAIE